jgi:beta-glucosidase
VTLGPGETCKLTFTLAAAQLAFYDHHILYVVEPGRIEVMLGSSAEDIRLSGSFEIVGQVTPVVRKVFFSQSSVNVGGDH